MGGETLEQVAQRSYICLIIGSVQTQVVQGFEQPDTVKYVPVHGGVGGWNNISSKVPSTTNRSMTL